MMKGGRRRAGASSTAAQKVSSRLASLSSHYSWCTQMEETKRNSSHVVIDARDGFFHAMLSYRVSTDAELVAKIHDKLHLLAPNAGKSASQVNQLLDSPFPEGFKRDDSTLNSSLHVFLDAYCLKDGVGWEGDGSTKSGGFVGAVRLSPVFVPLFSAVEVVTENAQLAQKRSGKGSVGQMINLAHKDMQDNVLLELIVARELHLMSKTNIKTNGKNVLAACSYILPLFRQDIWKCGAVSSLPKTASAITNAKAKHVLEQMDIPNEAISEQLRNETLTVQSVFEFFTQFQGIKLYDRGEERFQVAAAANAIISVVDEVRSIIADSKFHDLDMNSSQMNELSGFMSQLNMSNYTAILAIHHVSNVFQLAELKQSRADAIVQSIAEYGVRASHNSTLPIELLKVGSAINAAQSSPLAKSLNARFRNFIDSDASFVTMFSSSSLFDILLSKKLALVGLFLFEAVWLAIYTTASWVHFMTQRLIALPFVIVMLACVVAALHSPRSGRYTLAFAMLVWASLDLVQFCRAVQNILLNDGNCTECTTPLLSSDLSPIQKILLQPLNWIFYLFMSFCMSISQQSTLPLGCLFYCMMLGIVYPVIGYSTLIQHVNFVGIFISPSTWFGVFFVMKTLQYIGNRRAQLIYELNSSETKNAYTKLIGQELEIGSEFSRLCASSSEPRSSSQFPCIGTFTRHQPVSERFPTALPLMEVKSGQDQQSASHSSEIRRPIEASTTIHTPHRAESKASGKFQNILNIQDIFNAEHTLQEKVLQRHHSFENLIQDSEFINNAFQEWVSSWLSNGPGLDAVKKYFFVKSEPIDESFLNLSCKTPIKGTCIRGPLKHLDRAIAKVSILLCNFTLRVL
jgi:hypothetical protein